MGAFLAPERKYIVQRDLREEKQAVNTALYLAIGLDTTWFATALVSADFSSGSETYSTGNRTMEFFNTSKVFCATTALLLAIAAINAQPITSTVATAKKVRDMAIPVRQILQDKQALNVITDISEWTPPALGSEMDDDDIETRCATEIAACQADSTCTTCATTAEDGCELASISCSAIVDAMCCTYEDSCSSNTLLVAYVDCAVEVDGCQVEEDLCDTEDDNGTLDLGDTVCGDELAICIEDSDCVTCMIGDEDEEDDDCATAVATCDSLAEEVCCAVTGMSGCNDNDLLLDYVNCYTEDATGAECSITDVCDFDGANVSFGGHFPRIAIVAAAATGLLITVTVGYL